MKRSEINNPLFRYTLAASQCGYVTFQRTDGKEDHVWMDKSGFEEYAIGDGVSFGAEVCRYVKPEMEN